MINVTPREGTIFVDGKPVGAPPAEAAVDAGSHVIRVTADGFEDVETSAVIDAKSKKEIDLHLKKSGSILGSWWFWTGVTVVVLAGGAAITYALLTERSASSGDIAPGQVRGPLISF